MASAEDAVWVVEGWPQDLSTLPGHEEWTVGGGRGIFAESPDRVYLLGGGELPNIPRPQGRRFPEVGPSVQFPINGLPWRNANTRSPPSGGNPALGMETWRGASPPYRKLGVDARWEHSLVVVNAEGSIIEEWTQWDEIFKRPHSVYISPYDPEKHVWVVDDFMHAVYKFTNDGSQLVQIGADGTRGACTASAPTRRVRCRRDTRSRACFSSRSGGRTRTGMASVTRRSSTPTRTTAWAHTRDRRFA